MTACHHSARSTKYIPSLASAKVVGLRLLQNRLREEDVLLSLAARENESPTREFALHASPILELGISSGDVHRTSAATGNAHWKMVHARTVKLSQELKS